MEKRIDARGRRAEPMDGTARPTAPPVCRASRERSAIALERHFRALDELDGVGSTTTDFCRLLDAGVDLPDPAEIADADLTAKLWEVIGALAALGVYLDSTNHLSDRELYAALWTTVLRQDVEVLDERAVWHVDLIAGGGEEATRLYLKHYAGERERRQWAEQFPDDCIPAHADPPFDRDRKLPRP